MDIDYRLMGQRIKAARAARDLTCEQLAERVGISTESLAHIEISSNHPGLQAVFRIARELNVSLDYLTGRVSSPMETLAGELSDISELSQVQKGYLSEMINRLLPFVKCMK